MYILYFDEAGCTAPLPSVTSPISPLLVISGLIVNADFLPYLTRDFMALKEKFFYNQMNPTLRTHRSNWIRQEIKGADLRKILASSGRNQRRPKTIFLREVFKILNRYQCKMISRVFVKGINADINGVSVYTSTIQSFYGIFQSFLEEQKSKGLIVGDSRDAGQNSQVSHSIFSMKMAAKGDKFSNIIEMPTFAHSENSAGLQIADLLASGVVWPIAIETFCKPHLQCVHIRDYSMVKSDFLDPLSQLQYRYIQDKKKLGGIIIHNRLTNVRPICFFKNENQIKVLHPTQNLTVHAPILNLATNQT